MALGESDHGRVCSVQLEILVLLHQVRHPYRVLIVKVYLPKDSTDQRAHELGYRSITATALDHVARLSDNEARHHEGLAFSVHPIEHLNTTIMILVVDDGRSYEWRGINDDHSGRTRRGGFPPFGPPCLDDPIGSRQTTAVASCHHRERW
jgi:hypothetical protein